MGYFDVVVVVDVYFFVWGLGVWVVDFFGILMLEVVVVICMVFLFDDVLGIDLMIFVDGEVFDVQCEFMVVVGMELDMICFVDCFVYYEVVKEVYFMVCMGEICKYGNVLFWKGVVGYFLV